MCTWHATLFPASGIRPSYTRHLISGSRHWFFMIFIRSWCHMGLLLYSSHSSPHGHMRTLYNTKYFQAFTCFLYISSAIDIFGYFPCLLRYTVFCYVLTAAGSRSSFGYYHLSRQQPLLRLSACTSLLLFLLLSVIDDTSFLLHLNFQGHIIDRSFLQNLNILQYN